MFLTIVRVKIIQMQSTHQKNQNPHFYRDQTLITAFAESTLTKNHVDLPPDWWVVIADVIGSTKAIEQGAYKKVNTVGVACIAAVVNVDLSVEIPFVFGNLVFGLHKSREALVTCIVRSFTGNHMHFVDGSDGGYALAAKGLKQQLAAGL